MMAKLKKQKLKPKKKTPAKVVKPTPKLRKAKKITPPVVKAVHKVIRRVPPKKKLVLLPPEITAQPIPAVEAPQIIQPQRVEEIAEVKAEVVPELKALELKLPINVKDLAVKLQEKPSLLIKALMQMGLMAGINQVLEEAVVEKLAGKYGFKIKAAPDEEESALREHRQVDKPKDLQPRAPIVTLMGHVDHGKTLLLDAIRKSNIAESEYGGITQHIGAYRVKTKGGEITFLDTPGHEAFTALRARGASVTDAVVLVVASDDGVMPQTEEAIDHASAAGVPIIVAINKIDRPQANIERVKKQLSKLDLMAEDWGGKTIIVPVSAKTGEGVDDLLEMILLEAQMLELKANPHRLARGVVLEAKLTKGKGPVSTLIVQNGTLHLNENIIAGKFYGKIRAMFDDHGRTVTEVGPSFPVEVLGIGGVPAAGEPFFVVEDEKASRDLALKRQEKERQRQLTAAKRISLEDLSVQIKEGKLKELRLIIKADVRGSLEAIREIINKLRITEIKLNIIHEGVGIINASDALLAIASDVLILGFNVGKDQRAQELIDREGLDVRIYNIIYELASDIKAALEGMLEPKLKQVFLGRAEVRKVFKLSRAGIVAGCFVTQGKILRTGLVNLIRNGQVVFEGKISSLKRFKDDVREVAEGFECGISLGDLEDIKEGDIIEAYEIEKIARKL